MSKRPELPGLLKEKPRFRTTKDRPKGRSFSCIDDALKVYSINQAVEIECIAHHPHGIKVLVNNKHPGLVFRDNAHCTMKFGEFRTGYIKNVRPDGKLDVSFEKPVGKERRYDLQDRV